MEDTTLVEGSGYDDYFSTWITLKTITSVSEVSALSFKAKFQGSCKALL